MITKKRLSTTILFFVVFIQLFSQKKYKNVQFDVQGLPAYKIDSLKEDRSVIYYAKNGRKLNASIALHYRGGYKTLSAYCDSAYFNRADNDQNELNASALYCILFDEKLKIREIRIIKRRGYSNIRYSYDNLIKKILLGTEGNWEKIKNDSMFYFFLGYFNVR